MTAAVRPSPGRQSAAGSDATPHSPAGSDATRQSPARAPFTVCPACGAQLSDTSFVQEYWVGAETRYMVWCRACRATYMLVPVERYEGNEAVD